MCPQFDSVLRHQIQKQHLLLRVFFYYMYIYICLNTFFSQQGMLSCLKIFHEVTGPYIWGLILLLSLRAYLLFRAQKDYPHAAAFIVVAIAAAFMTASALDMLPPAIAEIFA